MLFRSDQEKAFVEGKQLLTSKPILGMYNPHAQKIELHTDASAEGLGAMLLQENEHNKKQLIYAISRRKLKDRIIAVDLNCCPLFGLLSVCDLS